MSASRETRERTCRRLEVEARGAGRTGADFDRVRREQAAHVLEEHVARVRLELALVEHRGRPAGHGMRVLETASGTYSYLIE